MLELSSNIAISGKRGIAGTPDLWDGFNQVIVLKKECQWISRDEEHLETQVVVVMITTGGGGGGNGGFGGLGGRGWQGAVDIKSCSGGRPGFRS
jgi:hypothetical protein